MANPETFYLKLPSNRPHFVPLNEEIHHDFNWLTKNRARSRQRDVFEVIDTVVIHATAGFATQHAVDAWRDRKASAHWIIPDENEPQHGQFAWATVAEAKAAYHVLDSIKVGDTVLGNGTNVNNRSLGIEVVNTQDVQSYNDPYSEWQITMASRIVLYAWAKYPNLKHIISHAKLDPSRRSDPGKQFPWDVFCEKILNHADLPIRNPLVFDKYNQTKSTNKDGCCLP